MLAVTVPWVTSVAVSVRLPSSLLVTERVLLPAVKAVLSGNTALGSVEVIATVSFVLTTFQLASTEFTIMAKDVPAV